MRVAVIGAGGWGTALALVCYDGGHSVTLLTRSTERADALRSTHRNDKYLPGIDIPDSIVITADPNAVRSADLVVFAVPSQALRETALRLREVIGGNALVVSGSKGIERGSLKRMSEILHETLGIDHDRIVVLSGPSHAEEAARKIPTIVISASTNLASAQRVQEAVLQPYFRAYRSSDVIGVELAGALKNVIAVCAGILTGEGYGDNTVAALVTRGLAEMSRLGTALGAQAETFFGIAGLGDLVVTCLSSHSRNRYVGVEIGKGRSLAEITESMSMVAEGVWTTQSAFDLARKHGIETPIIDETYRILFEGKDHRQATTDLMMRAPKEE